MHTNLLYSLKMSGDFDDVLKKHKLSGIINSATDDPKTVLVYNRPDGELIATTMREISDGSFEIYLPYREDESLTAICRDEGGDFNADIYDRLSLCTVNHVMLDEHGSLVIKPILQIDDTVFVETDKSFSNMPVNYIPQKILQDIASVEISNDVVFKNDIGETIDVENSNSLSIDNSIVIGGGNTSVFRGGGSKDVISHEKGIVHDIFGDGSCETTFPFDGRLEDINGKYSLYSGDIKFHATKYGRMLYQDKVPSYSPIVTNFAFQENIEYTLSFLYDSNYGGNSNLPIFQSYNGIYLYFNSTLTTLYFQTANYSSSWNAVKSWYHDTRYKPGETFHIAITFNNGFYTLFFNGVKISSIDGLDINSTNHSSYMPSLKTSIGGLDTTLTSYASFFGMKMLRVFNKICSDAEIQQLSDDAFLKRTLTHDVTSISATTYKDGNIYLNGPSFKRILDFPINKSIADVTGDGKISSTNGIKISDDYVNFNGTNLIHKADTEIDLVGGNSHGSESNLDIICDIELFDLDSKQVIWKSGDSANGIAIGIDASELGIFGRSLGTKTSIKFSTASLERNSDYKLHYSNGLITLYDINGVVVASASGTLTAADAISQESIGGAADGSPLTDGSVAGDSITDIFNGSVKNIKTFDGGTSKILAYGELKVAAEIGETGVQCKVNVEKWDALNNECIVWVTVPQILNNQDTSLRIYFDIDNYENPYVEYTGIEPSIPVDATQDEIDFRTSLDADSVIEYSTDLTEPIKEVIITIPRGSVKNDIENFPLKIQIDNKAGKDAFDATYIFENNETFEKVTLFDENGNKLYTEVAKWQKIPGGIQSSYIYPSTDSAFAQNSGSYYHPYMSFDKTRSLLPSSSYSYNQWIAPYTGRIRLNVKNSEMKRAIRIRLINSFSTNTSLTNTGIKNFSVYGTNDKKEFLNLNTEDTTLLNYLGSFFAQETTVGNIGDWQVFNFENSTILYEYFVFVFDDNYGNLSSIGVRRIEFDYDSRTESSGTYDTKKTVFPIPDTNNVKSTSIFSVDYEAWRAFDQNTSLISANNAGDSWSSADGSYNIPQKVNVDIGSAILMSNLAIDNGHSATTIAHIGIKNFKVYGTNESTAFDNVDSADLTGLTLLGTFIADEHPNFASGWTQNFSFSHVESYRYYVLIVQDSYATSGFMSIRRIEYQEDATQDSLNEGGKSPVYPLEFSFNKVVATTNYDENYNVYNAFDPDTSTIGTAENSCWQSTFATSTTPRRINIDYNDQFIARSLELQNYHSIGSYNTKGIKNFNIYGTNSESAFSETDPNVLTDLTHIAEFQAKIHVAKNIEDIENFYFHNETAYRYYVIIANDTWGDVGMGIRKAIFKEDSDIDPIKNAVGILYTKIPKVYADKDTNIILNYDSLNQDNSAYIGSTGTAASHNVWDSNFFAVYHLVNTIDPLLKSNAVLDSTSNAYHLNTTGYIDFDDESHSLSFNNLGKLYSNDHNIPIVGLTSEVYFKPNFHSTSYEILMASGGTYPYEYCLFMYKTGVVNYGNPGVAYASWSGVLKDFSDFNYMALRFPLVDSGGSADTSLYFDGNLYKTIAARPSSQIMNNIVLGSAYNDASPFHGNIHEFRYSHIERSDDWLKLTRENLDNNLHTLEKGSQTLLLNSLDGWEDGIGVIAKIPSGSIVSNTTDFDVPIKLKLSSGVNAYSFSNWFENIMKNIYSTGTTLNNYKFGSNNGFSNFNSENVVFSNGPYMNIGGALEFDGTIDKVITVENTDTSSMNGKGLSFTSWIYADTNSHTINQYYGILGFGYAKEFRLECYNNNLYIVWGNNATQTQYVVNNFFIGSFSHIGIRIEVTNKILNTGFLTVFLNGKLFWKAAVGNCPVGSSGNNFKLGADGYRTQYFNGSLSEIMLTSEILTDNEFKEIYLSSHSETYTSKDFITSVFNSTETIFNPLIGEDINGIVTNTNSEGQRINYSITFDNVSYCTFNGATWDKIVSNSDSIHGNTGSTNWHYKNIYGEWIDGGNDLNNVLSISSKINIMTGEVVDKITRGQFDLIYNKATGVCDFAVSILSEDSNSVPISGNMMYNNKKYWISDLYNLDGLTVADTFVGWKTSSYDNIDMGAFIKVYVKLDNGSEWTECTNGGSIPVLPFGTDTTGRTMKFRGVFDYSINPEFTSIFDSETFMLNVQI